MQAGTLLLILAEVILYLQSRGFIAADGTFDEAKFNDLQTDLDLASGVEAILVKHGVAIPDKVTKILQIIPLVAAIFR